MVSLDKLELKKSEEFEEQPVIPTKQVMSEVGKTSTGIFHLPSGYLDDAGNLHTEVSLREMDGRDEDLLANQKIPVALRLSKVIEGCILSIGPFNHQSEGWSDIVRSLPVIDRLWALLQIRILTVGPIYSAKVQCPNEECRRYSQQNVDLNEFKVLPVKNPESRTYAGVLPKSQIRYVCKVLTGADEAKLSKLSEKHKEDLVSLAIQARLLSLAGKPAPIPMAELKSLSLMDRQHLRNAFQKNEGEIERDMECVCPHCETEFTQQIELDQPTFFFPSET